MAQFLEVWILDTRRMGHETGDDVISIAAIERAQLDRAS